MFFADVKGGEELLGKLRANMRKFEKAMETILPEEARDLLSAASTSVPRQSGELAASAVVSTEKGSAGFRAAAAYTDHKAAAVHEGVHHGRFVEGTRGFKWLEHTLHAFEPGFVQSVAEKLKKAVG
jgi:hypothetical protein